MIDLSRQAPGLWHLVLFRWNRPGGAKVRLIADEKEAAMSDAISDRDFRAMVSEAPVPVVLHFADTESDALAGALGGAAAHFGAALRIGTLSARDNPHLCSHHGVVALPVLIVFQHGAELARRSGRATSEAELIAWLAPFAEGSCDCDRCR